MKIVVALTGASGVVIGKRLVEELNGHEVHLIVSAGARDVAVHEKVDLYAAGKLAAKVHADDDMHSPLASSSNPVDAMVIAPCSMKTLSAVANGYADRLIARCAENVLKTGRRLVVVPRDTPLTLAAIDNMRSLKLAGAVILPPSVAYYTEPRTVDDVTNFAVGKILDVLGLGHDLYPRWGQNKIN
jgi:flavin prenyltransferase